MVTGEVEAMHFLLNISKIVPYIYPIFLSQKFLFTYIILIKSGLTPCEWVFSDMSNKCIKDDSILK